MAKRAIQVATMTLGMVATNCYFVFDADDTDADGKRHGVLFDPADRGRLIYDTLTDKGFIIDMILLTHGHFDHIGGAEELRELTGAKIGCNVKEAGICADTYRNLSDNYGMHLVINPDFTLEDGEEIEAAGLKFKMIATPGHTSGSCCFYCEEGGFLIAGDTLFEESVGRTDFPTGSTSELVRSVKNKLFTLPDATLVYPGHGEITTIEHEKDYNPFVQI